MDELKQLSTAHRQELCELAEKALDELEAQPAVRPIPDQQSVAVEAETHGVASVA